LLAVVVALLVMIIPAAAQEPRIQLSIKPLGQGSSSFFTITAMPGETVQLSVELGNSGTASMTALTFAADTFTMPNGGFGIETDASEQTATTLWLNYPTENLTLQPDESVTRNFQLTIPATAQPGDYLTSLVIQNANAIKGEGAVALSQVVRQAVAIAIDVPGERMPALAINGVQHGASGARSVVTFDVSNTGNTHLKPAGEFVLTDADGTEIDRRPVSMDRFYAGTATTYAVAFDRLLAPGDYYAALTLTDPDTGATARTGQLHVSVPVIESPPVINPDGSTRQPAQTNASAVSSNEPSLPLLIGIAVGCLILGVGLSLVVTRVRSRRNASTTVASDAG
jgi:hypothetical protein